MNSYNIQCILPQNHVEMDYIMLLIFMSDAHHMTAIFSDLETKKKQQPKSLICKLAEFFG